MIKLHFRLIDFSPHLPRLTIRQPAQALIMLERLQKKWNVKALQLVLIICTFAIGGSLTGFVSRKILTALHLQSGLVWIMVFIVLATILWPLAVILVSIPFGQYPFFIKYIRKIGARMGWGKAVKDPLTETSAGVGTPANFSSKRSYNLAIFASGAGSNARKIIEFFEGDPSVHISLIVSNNPKAGVLNIATEKAIPTLLLDKQKFNADGYVQELTGAEIHLIILAGFLWKLPPLLIRAFPEKIINIHPALLPKFGGKGMYGKHVHQAVIEEKEMESGISIHFVDELYDHGPVIFQAKCLVLPEDDPDTLAQKIHALEHQHYPQVISRIIKERRSAGI